MMLQNNGGVVDPSLKVYGSQNYGVVDVGLTTMTSGVHIQGAILVHTQ